MQRESSRPILSAVFVDYDNIYLSLKRKNEDAAKRFAKDAASWVKNIASGALITPTNAPDSNIERRLVMNRCYGNPVPRRNQSDNSTDMNSFPFVRHHFLRSGFEIVDCPPLTAQLKNSSDIRMVMDIRDYLDHKTSFDEFIILSSDADFTPVLHRLRAHAKRTVIFANDHTAAPYTSLSDGEVRESDLIALLLGELLDGSDKPALASPETTEECRRQIVDEVVKAVLEASAPQPLEALADRATRVLGHDKTVATNWAGAGSFRDLLIAGLPESVRLTEQAPYLAYDVSRAISNGDAKPAAPLVEQPEPAQAPEASQVTVTQAIEASEPELSTRSIQKRMPESLPSQTHEVQLQTPASTVEPQEASAQVAETSNADLLQQSIARIHEACQAPPISPPEYRALFNVLAQEITDNQLQGIRTLENVVARAKELGIDVDRDDVRFVLDVVSEPDPWFENGASAKLFAGRFRNFVVARCRSQGLNLSVNELDLIDAWFAGGSDSRDVRQPTQKEPAQADHETATAAAQTTPPKRAPQNWWDADPAAVGGLQHSLGASSQSTTAAPAQSEQPAVSASDALSEMPLTSAGSDLDDFPRIVRNRLRG